MQRAVQTRLAQQRIAHQPSGIQHADDMLVLLDAEFPDDQLAVTSRLLPVDQARIMAPLEIAQRAIFGAGPAGELEMEARLGLAPGQADRLSAHALTRG